MHRLCGAIDEHMQMDGQVILADGLQRHEIFAIRSHQYIDPCFDAATLFRILTDRHQKVTNFCGTHFKFYFKPIRQIQWQKRRCVRLSCRQ